MSFDVYVQRFVGGEAADADGTALRELLTPHVTRVDTELDFAELSFDDGTADLYGIGEPGTGFMVNHVSGEQAWDLLARMATTAGLAMMAPGVPTMIVDEAARSDLPEELSGDAVVVSSGADILRLIAQA